MDEILMGRGMGKTKKEAQQNAAKNALEKEAKL
jgi:dsRNA-specific ribonuclease